MTDRRSRTAPLLVAMLLAVAVMAGCVRIPLGGDVDTASIADLQGGDELLVVPEGPTTGASQREILRGFLLAGRGPQNGYEVATEFLTDEFAAEWWPGASVVITSSPLQPVELSDTTMGLTVEPVGILDSHGQFVGTAAAPEEVDLEFEFELEEGQWRISRAPDGTVVSPTSFEAIFEEATLHFWSRDFRYLVPERRWFLDTRTIASRVVDELLSATTPYVSAGVLATAFPEGTDQRETVDLLDGRANVTLSSEVLAESGVMQSRMLAQLEWSLRTLGDVDEVTMYAGGFPLGIDPVGPIDRLQLGASPVVVHEGRLGEWDGAELVPLEGFGTALDGTELTAFTLARSRSAAAVLTAAGASVATDAVVDTRDVRRDLVAPSIDPWGWLWSVPRSAPDALIAWETESVSRPLPLELSGDVVALRISRDGTRLLAAVSDEGRSTVVVAGIERDDAMAPVGLVEPTVIYAGTALRDAVWASGTDIAVLATSGAVSVIELGGRSYGIGSVDDAIALAGGTMVAGLCALDEQGRLWRLGADAGWTQLASDVALLGVQQ